MSKTYLFCIAILTTSVFSSLNANDALKKKVLELFPQADTNGDGVLSDAEEAAVSRQALKRFPQADRDGDGVLSNAEKQRLLRAAANRMKAKPANPQPSEPQPSEPNPSEPNPSGARAVQAESRPEPSFANVKYGEHERNVFDIWLADTDEPAPLAIFIHGGGFKSGSKDKLKSNNLSKLLDAGISVAAINYRYATIAPLPAAHHDARRALQFIRANADEWNIDKDRVAAFGGSAGAQICMWLAFTDEMANPDSTDSIERESTRLTCVATAGGQTSNGSEFWKRMIGPLLGDDQKLESLSRPLGDVTGPEQVRKAMWGVRTLEEADKIASRYSAIDIVTADDPPIFMSYGMSPDAKLPSDPKKVRGWLIHHVNLGLALKERTDALNLETHLMYPGAQPQYENLVDFFADKLLEE